MSAPHAPDVAPYGSWRSPISAEAVARASVRFGSLAGDGGEVYWVEGRPDEGGRSVVVRRRADGRVADVLPAPYNARTRVHEYGGGAFAVSEGRLVFAHFPDQRLYLLDTRGERPPRPVTHDTGAPGGPRLRYADVVFDRPRRRLVCVREDHQGVATGAASAAGTPAQPVNTLVALDLAHLDEPPGPAGDARQSGDTGGVEGGARQTVLVSGADFYASPRLSPDGRRLAWLAWDHPNMPWDGTELWVGDLAPDGSIARTRRVAGRPITDEPQESIFQPEWGPDGRLYFVSDRSGWWNLYRLGAGDEAEPLAPREAEFGVPQWVFGSTTYGFLGHPGAPDGGAFAIVCTFCEAGVWRLGRLDPETGRLDVIATPYTDLHNLRVLPDGAAVLEAGSPEAPPAIVRVDLRDGRCDVLRRSAEAGIDPGYVSVPRAIRFPTTWGEAGAAQTAHAFFYPPANRDFRAPDGERPPLLVKSHGGPTSATSATFNLGVQFWTSRGIAVLDVNYGGSTGYGRAYRRRLEGQWGIVDVDDCVQGARFLAGQGEVDPQRLLISGGSAGGYTTLCALTFRDAFRAGGSYYGVSDLEALATDTHKFESRYLDRLVGPYPARRDLYVERSPIHHVHRLARPIIFFQGLEDAVVPPSQTETMVAALRARGLPVSYLAFPGEQHGFRRAEHIARALEAELYFYHRICGFPLADPVEAVPIDNL